MLLWFDRAPHEILSLDWTVFILYGKYAVFQIREPYTLRIQTHESIFHAKKNLVFSKKRQFDGYKTSLKGKVRVVTYYQHHSWYVTIMCRQLKAPSLKTLTFSLRCYKKKQN